MANFNFTEHKLAALKPPAKGELTIRDTEVVGLEVRVLASGAKSFGLRYRLAGRGSPQRRLTLGAAGEMRLDEARKAALKALAEISDGGDPVAKKQAKTAARVEAAAKVTTVGELLDLHEADQSRRKIVTATATAKMLQRDFVDRIGASRDVTTLTRADLVSAMNAVRDGVRGHSKPRPGLAATFRAACSG
jgi:hypothetical protein